MAPQAHRRRLPSAGSGRSADPRAGWPHTEDAPTTKYITFIFKFRFSFSFFWCSSRNSWIRTEVVWYTCICQIYFSWAEGKTKFKCILLSSVSDNQKRNYFSCFDAFTRRTQLHVHLLSVGACDWFFKLNTSICQMAIKFTTKENRIQFLYKVGQHINLTKINWQS